MSEQQVQAYVEQHQSYAQHQLTKHSKGLQAIQTDALARLIEEGFPTTRHEEWRYTETKQLFKQNKTVEILDLDANPKGASVTAPQIIEDSIKIVFINGVYCPKKSSHALPKGVVIKSMAQAIVDQESVLDTHLSKLSNQYEQGWTMLNSAFIQQGLLIKVDDNVVVDNVIEVVNVNQSGADNRVEQLRHLYIVGENSKVSIVERYIAQDENEVVSNVVSELYCGDKGNLTRVILQEHADKSSQFHQTYLRQGESSHIHNYTLTLTGRLIRNDCYGQILGEHSLCKMYGFYAPNGRQHIDNCTQVEHMVPNCVSDELYKGVLDDHGRAVFRGRIYVAIDAQKTDAYQTNRNLILSRNAEADTKPQLEIYADDVKCSHGATIGQLDDEHLFYLRSRGVEEKEARQLLIYAFVGEVLDTIENEALKSYVQEALRRQLVKGAMFNTASA